MGFFNRGNKKRTESKSEATPYKKFSFSDESPKYSSHKTLTKVSCHSCGMPCQVPFVPVANRPVYCNDCFKKTDSHPKREKSSHFKRNTESTSYSKYTEPKSNNSDLAQINMKLDKILKLLEQR